MPVVLDYSRTLILASKDYSYHQSKRESSVLHTPITLQDGEPGPKGYCTLRLVPVGKRPGRGVV